MRPLWLTNPNVKATQRRGSPRPLADDVRQDPRAPAFSALLANARQQRIDMLDLRRIDDQRAPQSQGVTLTVEAHVGVGDAVQIGDVRQADGAPDQFGATVPYCVSPDLLQELLGVTRRRQRRRLDHQLAKILQVPSATRSRLGRGQYLTPSEHNPIGLLEAALADVMAAEPIHERLCKAAGKNLPFTRLDRLAERALEEGKISADEAKILVKAEESRLRSINVDDFAPDALAAAKPEKPAAQSKRQQQTEAA